MHVSGCRIPCPINLSETSLAEPEYAKAFADRLGAELHSLHVVNPTIELQPHSSTSWNMATVDPASLMLLAEQRLSEANTGCPKELRVVKHIASGKVVDEILDYAVDHEIDLMIVGTLGCAGLSRKSVESVAERLVWSVTCPVLMIPAKECQAVEIRGEVTSLEPA